MTEELNYYFKMTGRYPCDECGKEFNFKIKLNRHIATIHLRNQLTKQRDDKDFFDVTLAWDDEQIHAHKVILSACSPFFRNILRRNLHQNPILFAGF